MWCRFNNGCGALLMASEQNNWFDEQVLACSSTQVREKRSDVHSAIAAKMLVKRPDPSFSSSLYHGPLLCVFSSTSTVQYVDILSGLFRINFRLKAILVE